MKRQNKAKLTLKETGECDCHFGIFICDNDGVIIECIAMFKEHKDALFYIKRKTQRIRYAASGNQE